MKYQYSKTIINVSEDDVAKRLSCGRIFNDTFNFQVTAESVSKIILEIVANFLDLALYRRIERKRNSFSHTTWGGDIKHSCKNSFRWPYSRSTDPVSSNHKSTKNHLNQIRGRDEIFYR